MIKKLSLKPKSGLLTPLQSDTIFGHFCWRMVEVKGEEVLRKFLGLYQETKPVFTLSDGLFEVDGEVVFPRPLELPTDSAYSLEKLETINNFLLRREILARKFISAEHLQLFLDGKMEEYEQRFSLENEQISSSIYEELRFHVRINRESFSGEDKTLFQIKPQYLAEETGFALLVKVIDKQAYLDYEVENILLGIFETGYGKKKSSGYGAFSVLGFSDYNLLKEPEEGSGFLSLGNYLPSRSDNSQPGYFDFMVKYGKLGENLSSGNNPFKKPIILMKPGSCFKTNASKPFYGRITTSGEVSAEPEVYHCGMPLTLNYK